MAPLGTETVGLTELGGRVFASDLVCPFDVPHFDNSQVDGYAVRASDGLEARRVVGVSSAGGPPSPSVGSGEAVRIFTGAPMPEGADAVAMQEDTHREGETVSLAEVPKAGDFIRRQGEEIRQGTSFTVRGKVATPPVVGLAASFGQTEFEVTRRPRVAIVATGSELTPVGVPLKPGHVYASNLWAIADAMMRLVNPVAAGSVPTSGGQSAGTEPAATGVFLVRDDSAQTKSALEQALNESDVLITLGGVSVGDHDLVRATLADLSVEEVFWRVNMKPGKPFFFGQKGGKTVFGLPGNPVSALVTFQVLVRPALRRMLGIHESEEETTLTLGTRIDRKDTRYEFVRATVKDGIATPVEHQGSHMQTGLAFADALIHLPDGIAAFEKGEAVKATPLRWGVR